MKLVYELILHHLSHVLFKLHSHKDNRYIHLVLFSVLRHTPDVLSFCVATLRLLLRASQNFS